MSRSRNLDAALRAEVRSRDLVVFTDRLVLLPNFMSRTIRWRL